MEPVGSKRCPKCEVDLPRTAFRVHRTRADGLQSVCKTCQHDYYAARYATKKQQINAQNEAYKKANPDKTAERHRRYYEAHKENYRRDLRLWRRKNWRRHYVNSLAKRSALLRGATISDFTLEDWIELLEQYGYVCAYCHSTSKLTMDHIVPLSKGGNHTKANIAPACQPCNSRKRDSVL